MSDEPSDVDRQFENEVSAFLRHNENLTEMNLIHEAKMADQEARMADQEAQMAQMQSTHEAQMSAVLRQDCDTGTCVTSS
jgi:hypothetical protein